jgi:ABC-type multidrug transport system fused ATPase/permease subunit
LNDRSEWRWLWRDVRPFVGVQIVSLICSALACAVGLSGPLIMKWLIDYVLPNGQWRLLAVASALLFTVYVGRMVLSSCSMLINTLAVQRLVYRLRIRLLRHVQALPASFHGEHPVGDLVQSLERDVALVGDLGSTILPSMVRMVVETGLTIVAMFLLDWRLTLVVAPLLPLFDYLRYRYRPTLQQNAERVRAAAGHQSSLLN